MSWSLFEARDQLAEQERRRQEIAAQQAEPVLAPLPAAAAMAGHLSGAMPLAGPASAPVALKTAEPDIGKRRKRKGHDLAAEEPAVTGPQDMARGTRDAMDEDDACKASEAYGSEGPGRLMEPARPAEAEQFDRRYESAGHASESPVAGAPRQNPIIHAAQGIVQPIELPGALVAGRVPAHVTQAVSLGSPSESAR